MNHGFVDGARRVAFAGTTLFLQLNGVDPTGTEEEWIAFIHENLEGGSFRKPLIEDWLNRHLAPREAS